MNTQTPEVEVWAAIVQRVEDKLLSYLQDVSNKIRRIHYLHGSEQEIVNTLVNMNMPQSQQLQKYPLIALVQDFGEDAGRDATSEGVFRPKKILICNQTPETGKAASRYTNNFKPILYPIYEELLRQLAAEPHYLTGSARTIRHSKWDHPFYGREGLYGNISNAATDCLDCMELRNLELIKRRSYCVSTNQPLKNF